MGFPLVVARAEKGAKLNVPASDPPLLSKFALVLVPSPIDVGRAGIKGGRRDEDGRGGSFVFIGSPFRGKKIFFPAALSLSSFAVRMMGRHTNVRIIYQSIQNREGREASGVTFIASKESYHS